MLQKQTENSSILNFPKSLCIFLNQETNIVTILQILFKFWHYLLTRFSFFLVCDSIQDPTLHS